jgi:hypothetical protein
MIEMTFDYYGMDGSKCWAKVTLPISVTGSVSALTEKLREAEIEIHDIEHQITFTAKDPQRIVYRRGE